MQQRLLRMGWSCRGVRWDHSTTAFFPSERERRTWRKAAQQAAATGHSRVQRHKNTALVDHTRIWLASLHWCPLSPSLAHSPAPPLPLRFAAADKSVQDRARRLCLPSDTQTQPGRRARSFPLPPLFPCPILCPGLCACALSYPARVAFAVDDAASCLTPARRMRACARVLVVRGIKAQGAERGCKVV
jgi:hypothetical protein